MIIIYNYCFMQKQYSGIFFGYTGFILFILFLLYNFPYINLQRIYYEKK